MRRNSVVGYRAGFDRPLAKINLASITHDTFFAIIKDEAVLERRQQIYIDESLCPSVGRRTAIGWPKPTLWSGHSFKRSFNAKR
jgi:hypothetical protein